MPAGTMTARRAVLRWLVIPAAAISLAAGLGPVVPAPHAVADAARKAESPGPPPGPGTPVTAYVADYGANTVIPIATATNIVGAVLRLTSIPVAYLRRAGRGARSGLF